MEPAPSTLIAMFLARVNWARVSKVDTRRYLPQYVTSAEAERLPWREFVDRLPVLFAERDELDDLEMVAVAKSLTWSDRDLNLYVGAPTRSVRSFLDFSRAEFTAVFGWHLRLASRVSAAVGCDVYVTHGFNPHDTSPDAHSIASRFHTHLHIPQISGRYEVAPGGLTHFERLALIEPYAEVFYDRAVAFLDSRGGGPWRAAPGFGFLTLTAPLSAGAASAGLHVLYELLSDLHAGYRHVTAAITDGAEEKLTSCARLVPRPRPDRRARMAEFLTANTDWLSESSAGLLTYLARHIQPAVARDHPQSRQIAIAGQAWLAKGLSGALNFVVSAGAGSVRFDVAPRVVSTSGATKVIGTGPTLVVKDQGPASAAQQRRMVDFHAVVAAEASAMGVSKA